MNALRAARKAIECMYTDTCTIYAYKKGTVNKEAVLEEWIIAKDEPCRLSKKQAMTSNQTASVNEITYVNELFLSSELKVPAGSRIIVTKKGVTMEFEQSGEPAIYDTHQEVLLKRIDNA